MLDKGAESLAQIFEEIARKNISVVALSLTTAENIPILRLLTDNPASAEKLFSQRKFSYTTSSVIALKVDKNSFPPANIFSLLADNKINPDYCYSILGGTGKKTIIFQPQGIEEVLNSFKNEGIKILTAKDFLDSKIAGDDNKPDKLSLCASETQEFNVALTGSLKELADLSLEFKENNIGIKGLLFGDFLGEADLKMILDDTFHGEEMLWNKQISYQTLPVLAVESYEVKNALFKIFRILFEKGFKINYAYSYGENGPENVMIFHFKDTDSALEVLKKNEIPFLSIEEILEIKTEEPREAVPDKESTKEAELKTRAEKIGVAWVNLAQREVDHEVVSLIPEKISRRRRLVCIEHSEKIYTLAMADPVDIFAVDEVRMLTGGDIIPLLAAAEDIEKVIANVYAQQKSDLFQSIDTTGTTLLTGEEEEKEKEEEEKIVVDQPIIIAVNKIFAEAVEKKASDIHIETYEDEVIIRYRIDGVLYQVMNLPKILSKPMISRIKIMSSLKLDEKRIPQDGRIRIQVKDKELDVRVSVLPGTDGEHIVMRLLDRSRTRMELEALGFDPMNLERFKGLITKPHGILLVTGPTGSGKSTTLYATLNILNQFATKIVTVEDPVEYHLKGIIQIQTNPVINLTFSTALRSILRHDPDILMIGEIRDRETASIAIEAALTGHLVLSTLHTNDSVGAIVRLTDMGVEPFLIASTVNGVLAQRLVRVICKNCKVPAPKYPELMQIFKNYGYSEDEVKLYRGEGCPACANTGYKGRLGIYELMTTNDELQELVVAKATSMDLLKTARKNGLTLLYEDGLRKVASGITTYEELCRVTAE